MLQNKYKNQTLSESSMNNSSKFFANKECEYYPCHKIDAQEVNCLFCYCPMYSMDNCPGNYEIIESNGRQVKSCMDCTFPHKAENYEKVMAILKAQLNK